jgi:hypothetical protein
MHCSIQSIAHENNINFQNKHIGLAGLQNFALDRPRGAPQKNALMEDTSIQIFPDTHAIYVFEMLIIGNEL